MLTDEVVVLRCPHVPLTEGTANASIRGLCRGRPGDLPAELPPRLVVAVCEPPDPEGAWVRELRSRGAIEPLVRVLSLDPDPSSVKVNTARVEAAKARLLLEKTTGRHHLRPRWGSKPGSRSRRALLGLPPLAFDPLPSVDPAICAAEAGCRRCLDRCPHEALAIDDGSQLVLDPKRCTSCGTCVSVCPPGATSMLGFDLGGVETEVETLLSLHPGTAIAFACPRRAALPGWAVVEVPCAGAVPAGMLLGAIALGASGVALAHCGEPCRTGDAVDARELVASVANVPASGPSSPLIAFVAAGQLPPEPSRRPTGAGSAPAAGWASRPGLALRALQALGSTSPQARDTASLGLGQPRIDPATCTRCGTCARVCPTGAIAIAESSDGEALMVDHAHCVSCGLCVANCPERERDAVRVEPVFDPSAIGGPAVAVVTEEARCERCGGPVAPRAMLDRLRALLGPEFQEERLARLCAQCRALG